MPQIGVESDPLYFTMRINTRLMGEKTVLPTSFFPRREKLVPSLRKERKSSLPFCK